MHRYGATPATGAGPAVPAPGGPPVPPPPGAAAGGATPPRDTAPRGTRSDPARPQDRLRAVHRQRQRVRLQQERPLSRARDRRGRSDRQRHPDPRHADRRHHAARDRLRRFYERMAWTEDGDALIAFKGKDDRQYRERLFGVVGYTGFNAKRAEAHGVRAVRRQGVSGRVRHQHESRAAWTEARDAFIFGIAKLTKVPPPAGRAGGAGAGAAAAGDASAATPPQGRGAGAASRRRKQHGEAEPGDLALQGSAPAVAAAGAGGRRPRAELRDDVLARRQEAGAPGG